MHEEDNLLRINFSAKTYIGKNSPYNTDFSEGFEINQGFCYVVCSGINGIEGEGGALAAKLAVEGVKRHFKNNPVRNPFSALQKAMMLANFMIYDHAMKNRRFQGMGVNILVVLLHKDLLFYGASGNIALYLERQMVLYHLINPEEKAAVEPITLFGTEKNARFNMSKNPVQTIDGDVIFCAETTLNNYISAEQMAELLAQDDISPDLLCYQIVYKLSEIEAAETITIAMARLSDKESLPPEEKSLLPVPIAKENRSKSYKKPLVLVGSTIAIIIAVIFFYNLFFPAPSDDEALIVPKVKKEIQKKPVETILPKGDAEKTTTQNTSLKEKTNREDFLIHTVQQGESLFRIGLRYNASVKELETINKTQAEKLKAGQKIKVPIIAKHKLQPGETISELAAKYGVASEDIYKANALKKKDILKAGQEIIIPKPSKK